MIKIVKELSVEGKRAYSQCLVQKDNDYFVVSSAIALFGPETLVFPADADGNVTSWTHVAGGTGMTREEAIQSLEDGDE